MVCVCSNLYPLVFIAGSHGVRLLQPTSATSGEATRGEVEAVGPMGQVGRLSWASLSGPRWSWPVLACLNWVLASLLVHGSSL